MIRYVEAQEYHTVTYDEAQGPDIFLAGGITGCADWQARAVKHFTELVEQYDAAATWTLYNPRRANFPDPPTAKDSKEQIEWEWKYLNWVDVIMFWFPASQSVQPIAMFELGAHLYRPDSKVVIGVEPGFLREHDVYQQAHLAGYDRKITMSLLGTVEETYRVAGAGWNRDILDRR